MLQSQVGLFDDVHFRALSKENLWPILAQERPWHSAGSFKSEGLRIALFDKLSGRNQNTLVGPAHYIVRDACAL
ncbi:MAG: Maf family protein [Symbiopectobacterium sp.]